MAAAVYVATGSLVIAMAGVFLWGVDVAFFMPPMQTVLQRSTPVEAHGRVMSLAATANGVGSLVAIPIAGVAVGAMGVSGTGALVGLIAVLAGLAGAAAASSRGHLGRRSTAPDDAAAVALPASLARTPVFGAAEAE